MFNYESSVGSFPYAEAPHNAGANNDPSALLLMLPYIEQGSLYNAANFMRYSPTGGNAASFWNNIDTGWNSTVQITKIATFLCPSDTSRISVSSRMNGSYVPGNTNYQTNAGADAYSFLTGTTSPGGPGSTNTFSGPFPSYSVATKLAQIVAGTSNTVGFSELVTGQGAYAGGYDPLQPSSSFANSSGNASGATAGNASPLLDNQLGTSSGGVAPANVIGATAGDLPNGSMWCWGRSGQTRYNHVMPLNSYNCSFGGDSGDSDDGAITASSRHPAASTR